MAAKDVDAMLVMASAFVEQEEALHEVRREVYDKLVEEAWRIAMRTRHYLTTQCLDTPSDYAWMMLYTHGSDINFITATSLTRSAIHQLLRRFSRFYYIPTQHGTRAAPKAPT
ncbi:hypothetical protein PF004_g4448 [Phytophthora fragariae]|uniref:Uncharacterized protein n=1 Tax=Phytophthora fragariae TaxID=53985 RepID=A0A6A3LTR8_9STRA|nr:hypothetical protein PF011_g4368 [Phytophthora fragariae]KAE9247148.1 hypothetical protein PF004_g4448 [Phytophthora fragariae]